LQPPQDIFRAFIPATLPMKHLKAALEYLHLTSVCQKVLPIRKWK